MRVFDRYRRTAFAPETGSGTAGSADGGGAAAGSDSPSDAAAAPAADAGAAGGAAADAGAAAAGAAATAPPAIDSHLLTDPPAPGEEGAEGAEAEADADADAAADAPVEYTDFVLPEGVTVDQPTLDGFKALAAELKLPQDGAQKLVDFYQAKANEIATQPYQVWVDQQKVWQQEVASDPEIGGKNLPETKRAAAAFLRSGADHPFFKTEAEATAFRDFLELSGGANNPAMVRMVSRAGKALLEGSGVAAVKPVLSGSKTAAQQFYGSQDQEGT